MTAVFYILRGDLRRRWRALVAMAALLGVAGGIVIALVAGAHRTDTAYGRFLDNQSAADVVVTGVGNAVSPADQRRSLVPVPSLPQVAQYAYASDVLTVVTAHGRRVSDTAMRVLAPDDGALGTTIDRFKIIDGRAADPTRPDEAVIAFDAADRLGIRTGDVLSLRLATPSDLQRSLQETGPVTFADFASGPLVSVTVTGVEASPAPGEFLPANSGDNPPNLYLTPAFTGAYGNQGLFFPGVLVRLRHGAADLDAFKSSVEALGNGIASFYTTSADRLRAERSIHLEAAALLVLAALAGVALLLVVSQAIARQVHLDAGDTPVLRALGLGAGQLMALPLLRTAVAAVGGAAIAVVVAVLLSPLSPLGTARIAEPSPGVSVDAPVLGLGGAAVVVLAVLLALPSAVRAARGARTATTSGSMVRAGRPSRAVDAVARLGAPPAMVAGVRLALDPGHGRAAVPLRTAVAGCAVAVATVVASLAFHAGVQNLLDTPAQYGWNWDVQVTDIYSQTVAATAGETLATHRGIAAVAGLVEAEAAVEGTRTGLLVDTPYKGGLSPTLVEGHAIAGDGEILLGRHTLPDVHIGQTVTVRIGDRTTAMRVAGRAVLPQAGEAGLGDGAWVTARGVRSVMPEVAPWFFLVSYAQGADPAAEAAWIERTMGGGTVFPPRQPDDIASIARVDGMPAVLGAVLAAAGVATLLHVMVTSVRRRRRDLAILRTLGFVRSQMMGAVIWQAVTLALIALLVGIPLGIASSRWAWTVFIDRLGGTGDAVLPGLAIAAVAPVTLAVAAGAAVIPARRAAAVPAGVALRAE